MHGRGTSRVCRRLPVIARTALYSTPTFPTNYTAGSRAWTSVGIFLMDYGRKEKCRNHGSL